MGDAGKVTGPTVDAWFASIVAPPPMAGAHAARSADLLSPPPGQRSKREGLGAYDTAAGVPFFELRDFMGAAGSNTLRSFEEVRAAAFQLLALEKELRTH